MAKRPAKRAANKALPKTATKTAAPSGQFAVSPINGSRIPLGAHPGNTGGKPGRSGRKPDEFKAKMIQLADDWADAADAVVTDPSHPHWMSAGKYTTDRSRGAVPKPVELTGKDGEPLTIRVVREG